MSAFPRRVTSSCTCCTCCEVPEGREAIDRLAAELAPRVCVGNSSSCSGFGYGDLVSALHGAASRGHMVLYDLVGVTRCQGERIQPLGGSTQGGFLGTLTADGSTARAFTVFESIVDPLSGDSEGSFKTSEMRTRSLNHMVVEKMPGGKLRPRSAAMTWHDVCVVQHSSSSACKWKGGSTSKAK